MNIIYSDKDNKKYKLYKSCYKNNFGDKFYNLNQLVNITGYTEYKINNVIRLASINSTELRIGKKIVNVYTHSDLKKIKSNLKSIKNFNTITEKVPYKSTAFHLFASRRLIKLS